MRDFLEFTFVIVGGCLLFLYGPDIPILPEDFTRSGKGQEFFGYLSVMLIIVHVVKFHLGRKGVRR